MKGFAADILDVSAANWCDHNTIVTTNISFERWDEIFKDLIMTAAMIDRLTHKAYIVNMNGNSYRLKETREWIENNNKIFLHYIIILREYYFYNFWLGSFGLEYGRVFT